MSTVQAPTPKRNLIILAKCNVEADTNFYHLLLKSDTQLNDKAIVYLMPTVEHLDNLLSSVQPGFSFSLLVHLGASSEMTKYDGASLLERLKKLPYGSKLKYETTSRQGNYVAGSGKALHSLELGTPEFDIQQLPLNRVADLELSASTPGRGKAEEKYDFAILTALFNDEHQAFTDHMDHQPLAGDKNHKAGTFSNRKAFEADDKVLIAWQDKMGVVDAAAYTARMMARYQPRFLILAGVCGGRQEGVNPYDIIIPYNINDYISGKLDKGEFLPTPLMAHTSEDLINYLKEHEKEIKANMRALATGVPAAILEKDFKIHFKDMACGPWVIKTNGVLDEMANSINANIKGLEMESLGVVRAGNIFNMYGQYGLVVKSVMDYTDANKTDGKFGEIKTQASQISYLCTRAMLPLLSRYEDPRMVPK